MTESDDSRSPGGGPPANGTPPPEGGPMSFFPAPSGRHTTPPAGTPLSGGPPSRGATVGAVTPPMAPPPQPGRRHKGEPPAAPAPQATEAPPRPPADAEPGQLGTTAVVKGRITIEDEVVEKIAALAALEVTGVAALSERAPGVRVDMRENEVALDLTIVVEYGCVIMDVARSVKADVARVAGLMLGMRVTAVNVVVDDVRMPGAAPATPGAGRRSGAPSNPST